MMNVNLHNGSSGREQALLKKIPNHVLLAHMKNLCRTFNEVNVLLSVKKKTTENRLYKIVVENETEVAIFYCKMTT